MSSEAKSHKGVRLVHDGPPFPQEVLTSIAMMKLHYPLVSTSLYLSVYRGPSSAAACVMQPLTTSLRQEKVEIFSDNGSRPDM